MNELKSYTEYVVSTPTADFVIGFDFNYGEDAVNVTVDGVPATTAGYTVVYLNETTIRLSPSVSSGVVRLQRETDIDQTDHAYRAGAKFIAQTMDENFEQLRHAQQEVRDGFSKLSTDTYEIIGGLDAALELAQDAAQNAQDAAVIAQGAADTVNTIIVGGKVGAGNVVDASGETQQEINSKQNLINLDQEQINSDQNSINIKQEEINVGVDSINDMLGISSPINNDRVFVKSYHEGLNKGGGFFVYDSTRYLENDGGLVINGWVRVGFDGVNAFMFGAIGDGVADDTASIQRAIDALAAIATSDTRQTLFFPSGSYHTTVTLQAKTWVAIVGENKTSTRFLDAFSTGTFALQQFTTFSDLLFETTLNESAYAFIGNNTSNINIQNVDVLGGEAFGNRSKFLKITGETWRTVLITNCVLDIGCQTGYGIDLQGSPTNPQNCDVHLDRVFLDTLLSPAFSCGGLRVKDIYGLHVRGSIFRTSANGSNITTEATNIALLKTDCVIENTSLDYGQTSFSSLFVGAGTKVILKNATFDTISNYGDVIIRGENNVTKTIPSNNRFTWFNKLAGTSYQEFNSGETVLNQPSRGTATDKPNPSILGVSIPSGDFTLIACLQGLVFNNTNRFGLCAFNSASGAHQAVQIFGSGRLTVSNYSLYTAFSADLINIPFKNPEKLWFKIQVSGSNIIYSVSTDSYAWTVLYTVPKTALTTFTHLGWFVDSESNVQPYMSVSAVLKSWVIF